eukprot:m.458992 g.458992  ORF g.458992 m.458992 type:complete len:753 (-) comp21644_c0_seq1:54-2312(-)
MLQPREGRNSTGAPRSATGGWTGAVSRRPKPTTTQPFAKAGSDAPTRFSQTLPSHTVTRQLGHTAPAVVPTRLHGTTAQIRSLDESLGSVLTDYEPTPTTILTPSKPLPVGKNATKAIKKMMKSTKQNILESGPPNKRKVAQPQSESDAKRGLRMQEDRNFRAWKAKKANSEAAERAKRVAERKARKEEEAKRQAARVNAHQKWVARKKREASSAGSKHRRRSFFTGALAIEEFIASVRRNRYHPGLLPILEELLDLLDEDRTGKVNRRGFSEILAQVTLQAKVTRRLRAIVDERDANPLPEKRQDWTPEQRNAAQREALEQRIGEKILYHSGNSLRALSKLLQKVDNQFRAADTDMCQSLKEDAIKSIFKEFGFGISATDQIEVIKIMRAGNSGERVDYTQFGEYLITVEARRQLNPEFHLGKTPQYSLAEELCHFNGPEDVYNLFDTCSSDAAEYRKSVNQGTCGWLSLRDFRSALQNADDNLPLAKRKDLLTAIDTYCKSIDADSAGMVEISRVDLFLRKIEIEIEHKAAREAIPHDVRRRHDLKMRYWKIAIANVVSHGIPYEKVKVALTNTLMPADDHDHAYMTRSDFNLAIKGADLGLSSVQIDEVARLYVNESNGRGVCREDVLADFDEAKHKAESDATRRADKRIQLAADILRSMGSTAPNLPQVLHTYQTVLMTWDAPKEEQSPAERQAEILELRKEIHGGDHAVVPPPTFDITWGHDEVTHLPIQMPPGEVRQKESLTLVTR